MVVDAGIDTDTFHWLFVVGLPLYSSLFTFFISNPNIIELGAPLEHILVERIRLPLAVPQTLFHCDLV